MTYDNDCRIRKGRWTTVRGRSRPCKLRHTLDEYEEFIGWQAQQFARRNYGDRKDFQQVGRQAVVQLFRSIEDGLKVTNEKGYYLNSINSQHSREACAG